MKRVPIVLLSLLSPMSVLLWSSTAMADPPGSCPGPIFIDSFDGTPATVCPRGPAHLDFFGTFATSFGTISVAGTNQPLVWNIRSNGSSAAPISVEFGVQASSQTYYAEGDFDGDGKSDLAYYKQALNGSSYAYHYLPSTGGPEVVVTGDGDVNVFGQYNGDYDCDGKTDPTFIKRVGSDLVWDIHTSGPGPDRTVTFGRYSTSSSAPSDSPLPGADWTGDGCDDLGTIRLLDSFQKIGYRIGDASAGAVVLEVTPTGPPPANTPFGLGVGFVVVGDFIGDERADFAIWYGKIDDPNFGGTWRVSENGGPAKMEFVLGVGSSSSSSRDAPLRGDFDGDGKDDLAVKKNGSATWQWRRSSDGVIDQTTVGGPNDFPLPASAF